MKTENTSTEKLIARRDALLEKAKEAANEIKRLQNLEADNHRQKLRYATAILGGYVAYQADASQRSALITAAILHEKKKGARDALELLETERGAKSIGVRVKLHNDTRAAKQS